MKDIFEVQVITEQKVTTIQRIITAVLGMYFFLGTGSIAAALILSFSRT